MPRWSKLNSLFLLLPPRLALTAWVRAALCWALRAGRHGCPSSQRPLALPLGLSAPSSHHPVVCLSQDHLQQCLFQAVQCSNESCRQPVLRKDLKEHLSVDCQFREEKCLYCKKEVVVINLQVKKKDSSPLRGLNSVWAITGNQMPEAHLSGFILYRRNTRSKE